MSLPCQWNIPYQSRCWIDSSANIWLLHNFSGVTPLPKETSLCTVLHSKEARGKGNVEVTDVSPLLNSGFLGLECRVDGAALWKAVSRYHMTTRCFLDSLTPASVTVGCWGTHSLWIILSQKQGPHQQPTAKTDGHYKDDKLLVLVTLPNSPKGQADMDSSWDRLLAESLFLPGPASLASCLFRALSPYVTFFFEFLKNCLSSLTRGYFFPLKFR